MFLDNFSGIEDIAIEAIQSFLSAEPQYLQSVLESVRLNDARSLEHSAHKLKGGLSVFFALEAQRRADRLEQIGANGSLEGASEAVSMLVSELDKVRLALRALLEELIRK